MNEEKLEESRENWQHGNLGWGLMAAGFILVFANFLIESKDIPWLLLRLAMLIFGTVLVVKGSFMKYHSKHYVHS